MKSLETQLVKSCLELLVWKQFKLFWRNNTGATRTEGGGFIRFGEVGSPDIFIVLPPHGMLVGIECKVGKNKLSDSQFIFGEKLMKAGGRYEIIRNLDDLERLLEELKN